MSKKEIDALLAEVQTMAAEAEKRLNNKNKTVKSL
jgi:hypothetical protein